mmetsp:Transcript_16368/g.39974  ORF Transcript_16368/g.39974 Transcript_16368/m.39974 type:complete len:238 (+) Transcript_16368:50-763(+)
MSFESYASQIKCANCGKTANKLLRCTACKSILYCNADCQRQHWRSSHKGKCKEMKAEKERWEGYVDMDLANVANGNGDSTGMFILACRLGVGDAAPMDPGLACELYEAAAKTQVRGLGGSGHPIAMLHLALHYERGIGVVQNHEKAFHYYKSVIEQPSPGEESVRGALLALCRFHRDGLGGAVKSMDLATKYFAISESNAESPQEIQDLEKWWEANNHGELKDETIRRVIALEPRVP